MKTLIKHARIVNEGRTVRGAVVMGDWGTGTGAIVKRN
jgi:hypothetical protein